MGEDELFAQRYVDGVLSDKEREVAEERIKTDKTFRSLVEELESVRKAFSSPPFNINPSRDFSKKVTLAFLLEQKRDAEIKSFTKILAWAAGILIVLGLGVFAGFKSYSGGRVIEANDLMNRYEELLKNAKMKEPLRKKIIEKIRKEHKK